MSEVPRRLRRDTAVSVFPRARYVSLLACLAVYGMGQRIVWCHFPDDFTLSQYCLLCSEDASSGVVATAPSFDNNKAVLNTVSRSLLLDFAHHIRSDNKLL